DLRSLPAIQRPWAPPLAAPRPPARVAWSPTLGYATVDSSIVRACERAVHLLEESGVEVVEVDKVFDTDPRPVIGTLVSAYTMRTIEPYRDTPEWDRLDPLVVASATMAQATTTALDMVRAED